MTVNDPARTGVLTDWRDQRRLDTRAMPWLDLADGFGSKIKVLSRDESGSVRVCMLWTAPSTGSDGALARGRVHKGARQLMLVLAGEQAYREYASTDGPGELLIYREGAFIDRSPGSAYSPERSAIGLTSLMWRTDPGAVPAEFDYPGETAGAASGAGVAPQREAVTSSPGRSDGVLIEHANLRVLDTRLAPWEDFSGLQHGKVKILTADARGNPMAFMVWIPPGDVVEGWALPHRHYHRSIREFAFMISGELPHWEYRSAEQQAGDLVIIRPGYFLDRSPGSIHGLEPGPTSPTGCISVSWRQGVGNWVNEPEFADETIEVPYAGHAG